MVCAVCEDEYYLAPLGCSPCSESSTATLVAIIFAGIVALAAVVTWIVSECCSSTGATKKELTDESDCSIELELDDEADESNFSIDLELDDAKGWTGDDIELDASDYQQQSGGMDRDLQADVTGFVDSIAGGAVGDAAGSLELDTGFIEDTGDSLRKAASGASEDLERAASGISDMVKATLNSDAIQAGAQAFEKGISVLTTINDKVMSSMGHFKIVFGVLQIISTFLSSFEVPWPSVFESWTQSIQFVNLRIFDVASVQCMRPESNFYNKLLMQIYSPIILFIGLWVALKFRIWKSVRKDPNDMFKLAKIKMKLESQHMFAFLFLLFVVYPGAHHALYCVMHAQSGYSVLRQMWCCRRFCHNHENIQVLANR